MPAFTYSHTYTQQPDIHIAAWPMLHPWGGEEQWSHSNASATGVTRAVACEAGAFVLCASNIITKENGMKLNAIGESSPGHIAAGGGISAIYGPDGRQISREIADDEDTILYATLDPDLISHAALVQDTVGHYSRPDIFTLQVNTSPQPRVIYKHVETVEVEHKTKLNGHIKSTCGEKGESHAPIPHLRVKGNGANGY
jgi:nitrilase